MLEGLKVIEYATYMAAPGAGMMLADWGAEVIKVEPPGGDPARMFFTSIGAEADVNPVFAFDNRGKRGVALDTTTEGGRAALLRLVAGADVFLTNVRPSALARAGLDHDSLAALNPRLVYASLTGYGMTGEDKDRPGFDIASFWARPGLAALFAPKGTEPFPLRTAFGDHVTSMAAAAGILAALVERGRTGKGRLVEASLMRAANFAMGSDFAIQHHFGKLASTRPRREAVSPLANYFRTKDDRWICLVPRQGGSDWPNFCRAVSRPDLIEDARFASGGARRKNAAALVDAFDEAFAQFEFAEAARRLDAEDIAWAPVQTAAEAVADSQLHAAGGVVEIPLKGGGAIRSSAAPVRFPGADDGPKGHAPSFGEHTREVLAELGYSASEIDALYETGAAR
ncbi:MAG: CoA transferase [Hydrogenophilaceae bacterium]|jgi:crotonobetainyl-CoA:carnitine CoA-transferase CaiB-like acyl-CoA transferase|nr:CoA transferase [Hydrogenophilaceae bacterium]